VAESLNVPSIAGLGPLASNLWNSGWSSGVKIQPRT